MRKSLSPSKRGFNPRDRQRLSKALTRTVEARLFRRIQAVLLVAEGRTLAEAVHITGLSLQSIYNLVHRYLQSHQAESLHDLPHTGRPLATPELTAARIIRELQRSPLKLGYRTNVWTVETLAHHLSQRYRCSIAPWTLRRRMKRMGLVCKRPRYFYSEKEPHRAQKKGLLLGN
jgi:transposase